MTELTEVQKGLLETGEKLSDYKKCKPEDRLEFQILSQIENHIVRWEKYPNLLIVDTGYLEAMKEFEFDKKWFKDCKILPIGRIGRTEFHLYTIPKPESASIDLINTINFQDLEEPTYEVSFHNESNGNLGINFSSDGENCDSREISEKDKEELRYFLNRGHRNG